MLLTLTRDLVFHEIAFFALLHNPNTQIPLARTPSHVIRQSAALTKNKISTWFFLVISFVSLSCHSVLVCIGAARMSTGSSSSASVTLSAAKAAVAGASAWPGQFHTEGRYTSTAYTGPDPVQTEEDTSAPSMSSPQLSQFGFASPSYSHAGSSAMNTPPQEGSKAVAAHYPSRGGVHVSQDSRSFRTPPAPDSQQGPNVVPSYEQRGPDHGMFGGAHAGKSTAYSQYDNWDQDRNQQGAEDLPLDELQEEMARSLERLHQLETFFLHSQQSAPAHQQNSQELLASLTHSSCVHHEVVRPTCDKDIWTDIKAFKRSLEDKQIRLAQITDLTMRKIEHLESLVHGQYGQGLVSHVRTLIEDKTRVKHRLIAASTQNSELSSKLTYYTEKANVDSEMNERLQPLEKKMQNVLEQLRTAQEDQEEKWRTHFSKLEEMSNNDTFRKSVDALQNGIESKLNSTMDEIQSLGKSLNKGRTETPEKLLETKTEIVDKVGEVLRQNEEIKEELKTITSGGGSNATPNSHVEYDTLKEATEQLEKKLSALVDSRHDEESRIENRIQKEFETLKEMLSNKKSKENMLETVQNDRWKLSRLINAAMRLALSRFDGNVELPEIPALSDDPIQLQERLLFNTVVATMNSIYKDVDEKVLNDTPPSSPQQVEGQLENYSQRRKKHSPSYGRSQENSFAVRERPSHAALERSRSTNSQSGHQVSEWLRDMHSHFQHNRAEVEPSTRLSGHSPTSQKLDRWFSSHAPWSTSSALRRTPENNGGGSHTQYASPHSQSSQGWSVHDSSAAVAFGEQQAELDATSDEIEQKEQAVRNQRTLDSYRTNEASYSSRPLSPNISGILKGVNPH
eukprot:gb/GECG01004271.1/.p1 GENE.gb/GECG01004271.1/~~gb/GECG01004271.1/.p1  ORF type:complete len:851 (+),score=135.65 gb/GECG01004271.1/:1-2553(+)